MQMYRKARDCWAELANVAKDIYEPDITVGEMDIQRGHWLDRLPAINDDIDFMAKQLDQAPKSAAPQQENVRLAIQEAMGRPKRESAMCRHQQPARFALGEPLDLQLSAENNVGSVRLYYRHVNHAERFASVDMERTGDRFRAHIPGDYTNTEYPIQYYFELRNRPGSAWFFPGFNTDLTGQPYFVVRSS